MLRKPQVISGVTAFVAVPLLLGTILVLRSVGGFRAQVILSDSMKPTFAAGSLVLVHYLPPWKYREGDVVSFVPPIKVGGSVTHRVVRLYSSGGVTAMQTKGDGNRVADSWNTSVGAIIGKEVLAVPYIGYPVQLAKTPLGFIFLVTATFFAFVWRELILIFALLRPYFRTQSITNDDATTS